MNDIDRLLVETGTTVLKIFLNIFRAEQHQRNVERWEMPDKCWKLTEKDPHQRGTLERMGLAWPEVDPVVAKASSGKSLPLPMELDF